MKFFRKHVVRALSAIGLFSLDAGLGGVAHAEYLGDKLAPGAQAYASYPVGGKTFTAAYLSGWGCRNLTNAGYAAVGVLETGRGWGKCTWTCPDGYCLTNGNTCKPEMNGRDQVFSHKVIIDPTHDNQWETVAGAGGELHVETYVNRYYQPEINPVGADGSEVACRPNYLYNYYQCDPSADHVKTGSLTEKTEGGGTCEFTCDEGYNYDNKTTYTVTLKPNSVASGNRVTITAQACSGNDITLKYDSKGGSTVSDGGCIYGKTFTAAAAPTRTGYTFKNWVFPGASDVTGGQTGLVCSNTLLKVTSGTASITATWTANTYTVKYDANGGTGTTASSSHEYNKAKALTSNGFTRDGYKFTGWTINKDGSGAKYTNGESVTNLSSTQGATVTLYAQWSANAYSVTYDCGDGYFGSSTTVKTKTYENAAEYGKSYEIPTEAYCTHATKPFGGWNFPN